MAPHEEVRSRQCSVVRSVFLEQQRGRCACPPPHLPRPWRFLHYTHGVAARWLLRDVPRFDARYVAARQCVEDKTDSSENVTVRHCCLFHLTWLRANWRRAALCLWERQGFLAGTRDLSPAAWSRFRMVWTETGMPPAPRCCRIRLVVVGALVKRFLSVVLMISRSSARFVALGLPERGRCCKTLPYPVDGLSTSVKCHGNPATRLYRLELTQCPTSV